MSVNYTFRTLTYFYYCFNDKSNNWFIVSLKDNLFIFACLLILSNNVCVIATNTFLSLNSLVVNYILLFVAVVSLPLLLFVPGAFAFPNNMSAWLVKSFLVIFLLSPFYIFFYKVHIVHCYIAIFCIFIYALPYCLAFLNYDAFPYLCFKYLCF